MRAPALELYRGVMYETYRAHRGPMAGPAVVILSAKHGLLSPSEVIDPYDMRMSARRAQEILVGLEAQVSSYQWPTSIEQVFLAGGAEYRRVMTRAIEILQELRLAPLDVRISSTCGGLGYQRSQLREYLRSCALYEK